MTFNINNNTLKKRFLQVICREGKEKNSSCKQKYRRQICFIVLDI